MPRRGAPLRAAATVRYTVEEKPLKAAVAGTSLTFALYSDAACTTLVQSAPVAVAVEDGTLILLSEHLPKRVLVNDGRVNQCSSGMQTGVVA